MSTSLRRTISGFILTTVLLAFSCSGPGYKAELALNKTCVIGHAGMGFSSVINPFNPLPDNSMGAIIKALELGADGVEVDVQMSKDSVLVLYHDNFLDSKTHIDGCIAEKPASEIIGQPYKSDFPFSLMHDEKIISLDSLFHFTNQLDSFPQIHLDFHIINYCNKKEPLREWPGMIDALKKAINLFQVPFHKIYLASNYEPMLDALRKSNSSYRLFYEEDLDYETGLKIVIDKEYDGILIKKELVPDLSARIKAKKLGKEVIYFGGKSKSDILKMLETYPDAIQVNNVKAMVSALND